MYRIALINMPFAALNFPSLALTQLQSVVAQAHAGRAEARVHYLHHEFVRLIGVDDYQSIANEGQHFVSGVGDWLFRQVAFPDADDNTEEYLRRYYPRSDAASDRFKRRVHELRTGLEEFLEGLVDEHQLDHYDLVGLTSMFSQHVASLALARLIKRRNPDVCVVMGGANCEWPMGGPIARHVDAVDYVFSGGALRSFPEFVGHLLDGHPERCLAIDGVFSADNQAHWPIGDTPNRLGEVGRELELDREVRLDYEPFLESFEQHVPAGSIVPYLMFETSRGCWWGERAHCTFCGLNGQTMAYRSMAPSSALAQFERIFEYGERCSHFLCVDNILPTSYVQDVVPYIDPPPGTVIFYEVKADLKGDDLAALHRAGITLIQPGIEALATSTLKRMRKGTTSFQNLDLLKGCLAHNVYPVWNLLVGFPGEGEEVYEKYVQDLPRLAHLPPPNGVFPVRFDRYSPYFGQPDQWDLELDPYDFYGMTYPFTPTSISQLAYYFMDRNYTAAYIGAVAHWIGPLRAAVEQWRRAWQQQEPLPPQLYLERRDGTVVVHDTRDGRLVQHELRPSQARLIELLDRPRHVGQVAPAWPEAAGDLEWLLERGLLFEDGGRVVSLVLGEQPPLESYYSTTPASATNIDDGGFDPRRPIPDYIESRLARAAAD